MRLVTIVPTHAVSVDTMRYWYDIIPIRSAQRTTSMLVEQISHSFGSTCEFDSRRPVISSHAVLSSMESITWSATKITFCRIKKTKKLSYGMFVKTRNKLVSPCWCWCCCCCGGCGQETVWVLYRRYDSFDSNERSTEVRSDLVKGHENSLKDGEGTMRSIPKKPAERGRYWYWISIPFPECLVSNLTEQLSLLSSFCAHNKNVTKARHVNWRREKLSPGHDEKTIQWKRGHV